jgi:hypothetical protein
MKRETTVIRIPTDLFRDLQVLSQLRRTTVTDIAAQCIRYGMERTEVTGIDGLRSLAKSRYDRDMALADQLEESKNKPSEGT